MSSQPIRYYDETAPLSQRQLGIEKFKAASALLESGDPDKLSDAHKMMHVAAALGHGKAQLDLIKMESRHDLPSLPPVQVADLLAEVRQPAPEKQSRGDRIRGEPPRSLPPVECLKEPKDDLGSLTLKAQNGNVDAMVKLADWLYWGTNDTPKNPIESYEWMELAAKAGHPRAQWFVGRRLFFGWEAAKDEERGMELIGKSADGGYWRALNFLLFLSIDRDANDKPQTLMNAVFNNDKDAILQLAGMYRDGDGLIQSDQKATLLKEAAKRVPPPKKVPRPKKMPVLDEDDIP